MQILYFLTAIEKLGLPYVYVDTVTITTADLLDKIKVLTLELAQVRVQILIGSTDPDDIRLWMGTSERGASAKPCTAVL